MIEKQFVLTLFIVIYNIVMVPDIKLYYRFSYDEGQCWNSFKFTEEKITVTGLLPEPSKKSLNVSIWGFGEDDSQWRSFMINFGSILSGQCEYR